MQCLEFIDFDDPGARRRILGDGRAKQGEGLLPSGGCRFDARQAEVEPGDSREVPPGIFGDIASPLPVTALHQEEEVGDPQAWVAAVGRQELSELGVGIVFQRLTGESFGEVQTRDFQARHQVQGRACLRCGFGRAIEAQEDPAGVHMRLRIGRIEVQRGTRESQCLVEALLVRRREHQGKAEVESCLGAAVVDRHGAPQCRDGCLRVAPVQKSDSQASVGEGVMGEPFRPGGSERHTIAPDSRLSHGQRHEKDGDRGGH